ncbi:KipI family sensor histidine kinase inhibitor [Mumia flava]|uniref:KipI family sensor histidine kinase inhibitor n=1 Tax=Mumia flava TaxID=1348852 RepID=A0A0B2BM09_9ACTN|nr:allophanate hydrolase subunit 1 [Mumia flava]PJJ56425.1 KipI family sensor histidine kinase inhibitor [Mumia flava]
MSVRAQRVVAYGDRAVLVELAGPDEVVAWTAALRAGPPGWLADLVPAARTVLVVGDGSLPVPQLAERVARIEADADAGGTSEGREVRIEVRYDGPDLAEVARATGLDEAAVVRAHTAGPWRVAFGGFAPGFAYLVGGDPRLRVGRRDAPRPRVPAGAVGLAGAYTGVYPRESPGGWQLIGHTDAALWDVRSDPPALLAPGDRVHFVEIG